MNKPVCIRARRVLRCDSTFVHKGKLYQVEDEVKARKVQVELGTDGTMRITHNGVCLRFRELAESPQQPASGHPWKKTINRMFERQRLRKRLRTAGLFKKSW